MRIIAISLFALTTFSGCMSLHATVPEDAVRRHMALEDGIDLGNICSNDGKSFSEGAAMCMAAKRMTCDSTGRWVPDGPC